MTEHMHTLYFRYSLALGVESFGAFCTLWPKVCALLDAPATLSGVRLKDDKKWNSVLPSSVGTMILAADTMKALMKTQAIRLADGTVVREWLTREVHPADCKMACCNDDAF